jgi:broad specificity phosphatase PhoE
MSSIIFLRHAETDAAGTFCGWSDPPVNTLGMRQIASLIASLKDKPVDIIYASDLARARTTARALADATNARCLESTALREIHFGDWEGLHWNEVERRDPAFAKRWAEAFPQLPAPGGESFQAFRERVLPELDRLIEASRAMDIAVVTHAGVMRLLLTERMGVGEAEAWQRTSSYCCRIDYEEALV